MTNIKNKKSQVTIFIIIAILFIVGIMLFFFLMRVKKINIEQQLSPNSYIESCVRDAVDESVNIMLPQGGYISPKNYILYENNKIAYLCYNKNYYHGCINQEPNYIKHLEEEIADYITPKINECFYSLKSELEKRKNQVEIGELKIEVKVVPNRIEVEIDTDFKVSKNEVSDKYKEFKIRKISPLFELADIAREIANQEAKYCNFEYLGFMLFYPKFNIDKKSIGQGETASKIYIIEDRLTRKKLNIAIRSCAIPPGLF